jgi:hypothetical protein
LLLLLLQVYEAVSGGADEVDLNGRKVNARAYCSWYNFKSGDQQKKVGVLSGVPAVTGQQHGCSWQQLAHGSWQQLAHGSCSLGCPQLFMCPEEDAAPLLREPDSSGSSACACTKGSCHLSLLCLLWLPLLLQVVSATGCSWRVC